MKLVPLLLGFEIFFIKIYIYIIRRQNKNFENSFKKYCMLGPCPQMGSFEKKKN